MISFCTTSYNRLHQLQVTWDANLEAILRFPQSQWVVVDFGSVDGTDEFLRAKLGMMPPRVIWGRALDRFEWTLPRAKNVAHAAAAGDVLYSLDCDNFIADSVAVVEHYFSQGCRLLHHWSGVHGDGTSGRIAVSRPIFEHLGGYDESFYPMGYQDLDLLERASHLNIPVLRCRPLQRCAVKNSKDESVLHCRTDGLTWVDYDRLNRQISRQNIAAGRLRANTVPSSSPPRFEFKQGTGPG
ncbi:MAG: hypothetical protein RLZZ162_2613 [Verrucomicrobiota bacterium]|jgi:hypothetical protein